ncbi:MAG: lysozyme inhibitor LprI family protein [Neisseria sp.]|nr:lysozyme inhibitor LprI family protein [Neisseria sp.]
MPNDFSQDSYTQQLEQLIRLKHSGLLTDAEFAEKKKMLDERYAPRSVPVSVAAPVQTTPPADNTKTVIISVVTAAALILTAVVIGINLLYSKPNLEYVTAGGPAKGAVAESGAEHSSATSDEPASYETAPTEESDPVSEQPPALDIETETRLFQAQERFQDADKRLSRVWTDLNPTVRDHLKKDQIAWNRRKDSYCKQQEAGTKGGFAEQETVRLNCLSEWNNGRIPELQALEKEWLPKARAKEEYDAERDLAKAQEAFDKALEAMDPDAPVDDLDVWLEAMHEQCSEKGRHHLDSSEAQLVTTRCIAQSLRTKTKLISKYRMQ